LANFPRMLIGSLFALVLYSRTAGKEPVSSRAYIYLHYAKMQLRLRKNERRTIFIVIRARTQQFLVCLLRSAAAENARVRQWALGRVHQLCLEFLSFVRNSYLQRERQRYFLIRLRRLLCCMRFIYRGAHALQAPTAFDYFLDKFFQTGIVFFITLCLNWQSDVTLPFNSQTSHVIYGCALKSRLVRISVCT
jgi:hypothetical protein